jgi:thiamine transporter ThiT
MFLIRGLLKFIIKVYPIQLFLGLIFPVKQDILAGSFKDRQIGVETKTKKNHMIECNVVNIINQTERDQEKHKRVRKNAKNKLTRTMS